MTSFKRLVAVTKVYLSPTHNHAALIPAISAVTSFLNFTGNALNNEIKGNDRANVITGGAGTDSLYANGGNDLFIVAAAADYTSQEIVDGGAGVDELRFTSTTVLTLKLNSLLTAVESVTIGTGTGTTGTTTGTTALNVDASAVTYGYQSPAMRERTPSLAGWATTPSTVALALIR